MTNPKSDYKIILSIRKISDYNLKPDKGDYNVLTKNTTAECRGLILFKCNMWREQFSVRFIFLNGWKKKNIQAIDYY